MNSGKIKMIAEIDVGKEIDLGYLCLRRVDQRQSRLSSSISTQLSTMDFLSIISPSAFDRVCLAEGLKAHFRRRRKGGVSGRYLRSILRMRAAYKRHMAVTTRSEKSMHQSLLSRLGSCHQIFNSRHHQPDNSPPPFCYRRPARRSSHVRAALSTPCLTASTAALPSRPDPQSTVLGTLTRPTPIHHASVLPPLSMSSPHPQHLRSPPLSPASVVPVIGPTHAPPTRHT